MSWLDRTQLALLAEQVSAGRAAPQNLLELFQNYKYLADFKERGVLFHSSCVSVKKDLRVLRVID